MADPKEVMIVAAAICNLGASREGEYEIKILDHLAEANPIHYHKVLEEAEHIIDALDDYRKEHKR